ncbi:MAG: hypothetical protein J7L40_01755 [Candidatus Marinimicrobia bacterium]|nr:hypothetical protein [Candidatus Neomarinimicrobiota bacterium]
MKRVLVFSSFIVLLLLVSCIRPEAEFEGTWLETLIYHAENGTDSTYTQAIFSYEYEGQPVYYTLTFGGAGYNYVYDTSGTQLGAPDGGWYNTGDETLPDFFDNASNETLIWSYDFPRVAGVSDEYAILNAALSGRFYDKTYLHVERKTHAYTEYFSYQDKLNSIDYDTLMVGDFLLRNSADIILDPDLMIDAVETIHENTLNNIWTTYEYPEDWQYYYSQYPLSCGIISLSRPGFSSDGNTAIMKLGWQFSGDGGQGYMYVLKKYDDIWLIRWTFYTWVS